MSNFNVWNHVEKRAISYQISDVLDSTVVKAVETACSHFSIDAHTVRVVSMSVRNGLLASIDSAMSFHSDGREFRSWELAAGFLTKQIQGLLKDELDPHRHHFLVPESTDEDSDERWGRVVGFVASEAIAILKSIAIPRPPKRPGY